MTADDWAVFFIVATSIPTTLFVLIYGTTTRWFKSMIGRALLISSAGLAALVDISLLYQFLGPEYRLRDAVRLTVYGLICLGAWLKFLALIGEKYDAWREKRDSTSA